MVCFIIATYDTTSITSYTRSTTKLENLRQKYQNYQKNNKWKRINFFSIAVATCKFLTALALVCINPVAVTIALLFSCFQH